MYDKYTRPSSSALIGYRRHHPSWGAVAALASVVALLGAYLF